jgi:peptidoglycan hydrolase CwlO-like protein
MIPYNLIKNFISYDFNKFLFLETYIFIFVTFMITCYYFFNFSNFSNDKQKEIISILALDYKIGEFASSLYDYQTEIKKEFEEISEKLDNKDKEYKILKKSLQELNKRMKDIEDACLEDE